MRLTKRDIGGNARKNCEYCEIKYREGCCNKVLCQNALIEKLAEYEDTGYLPPEIKSLERAIAMRIKDIPRGDYFVTTRIAPDETPDESRVWVRGEYSRTSRKYECYKWEDVNHTHEFDGSKTVYTDFIF